MGVSDTEYESGVSKVRSFRIDTALDDALQAEAEAEGKTLSNLLNSLLKNTEFTSKIEKINSVTMSEATLRGFLDYLSIDECYKNGLRLGGAVPKQMLVLSGKNLSIDSLQVILDRAGENAGWCKLIHQRDDRGNYIFIQNILGPKWSGFLQGYLTAMIRSLGSESIIETIGDNLILRVVDLEE